MAKTLLEILKELNVNIDDFLSSEFPAKQPSTDKDPSVQEEQPENEPNTARALIKEFTEQNIKVNRENLATFLNHKKESTLYKVLIKSIDKDPDDKLEIEDADITKAASTICQIKTIIALKEMLDKKDSDKDSSLTKLAVCKDKISELSQNSTDTTEDKNKFLKELCDNTQNQNLKDILLEALKSPTWSELGVSMTSDELIRSQDFYTIKNCIKYIDYRLRNHQPTPTPDAKEKETPSEDQEKKDRPEPTPSQTPSSGTVSSPITPDQFKKAAADTFKELYTGKFSDDAKDFNFTNNDNQACTNIGDYPGTLTRKDSTDQSGKQLTQITAEGFGDADANLRAAISTIVNIAKQLHSSANNSRIQYTCALSYDDSSLSLDQAKLDAILKDLNYDQTKEPVQFYPAGTKKPAVNAHLDEQEKSEEEKNEQEYDQLKHDITNAREIKDLVNCADSLTQHILKGKEGEWDKLMILYFDKAQDLSDEDKDEDELDKVVEVDAFLIDAILQPFNGANREEQKNVTEFLKKLYDKNKADRTAVLKIFEKITNPTVITDLLCHLLKQKHYENSQSLIDIMNQSFDNNTTSKSKLLQRYINAFLEEPVHTPNESVSEILKHLLDHALNEKPFVLNKETIEQLVKNTHFTELMEKDPPEFSQNQELLLQLVEAALEEKNQHLILNLLEKVDWDTQLNTIETVKPFLIKACQYNLANVINKILDSYKASPTHDFRKNLDNFLYMIHLIANSKNSDQVTDSLRAILKQAALNLTPQDKTTFLQKIALIFSVSFQDYDQLFYKDSKNANIIFFDENGFFEDLLAREIEPTDERIIERAMKEFKEAHEQLKKAQNQNENYVTLTGDIKVTFETIKSLSIKFYGNDNTRKFSKTLKGFFKEIFTINSDDIDTQLRQKKMGRQNEIQQPQAAVALPSSPTQNTISPKTKLQQDAIDLVQLLEKKLSYETSPSAKKNALEVVKCVAEFVQNNNFLDQKYAEQIYDKATELLENIFRNNSSSIQDQTNVCIDNVIKLAQKGTHHSPSPWWNKNKNKGQKETLLYEFIEKLEQLRNSQQQSSSPSQDDDASSSAAAASRP